MNIRTEAGQTTNKARGKRTKRVVIAVAIIAVLGGVVWFAVHLGKTSKPVRRGFRPTTTVGVATAQLSNIPITLDALGTVTPAAKVTVIPQVSGVITQILFKEGQMVKKGDALAVIDPRPLQNALQQAQGQLAQAQAQLADAQVLLQRDQTLLAQDSIARQVVDTQSATVKQLQGVVTTDQAAVATARLNLSYSRVVSPVAGRVGLRVVDVGNYIGAGAAAGIAVVTQVNPIDVEFTVPQDNIPQIQQQSAESKLAVTALDRTRTITLDKGVFSTLDNQVDATTGTVRAKARFANAEGTLFPNQFVNVELNLQPVQNVVAIPVTAVRSGPNGDFVWVLKQDKTVTQRIVVRGPATATETSITKGLQPCEQVITEGGDRLTEGARVTLPGDRPQAGGPGANGQRRRRPNGGGGPGGAGGQGGQGFQGQGAGQAAPGGQGFQRQGGGPGEGGQGFQRQGAGQGGQGEGGRGFQRQAGGPGGAQGPGGQFGGRRGQGLGAGGAGGACNVAGGGQGGRRGPGGQGGQGPAAQGGAPGQTGPLTGRGQFGREQGGEGQGGQFGGRRGQGGQGQAQGDQTGAGGDGQGQGGGRRFRGEGGQGQGGQGQGAQGFRGQGGGQGPGGQGGFRRRGANGGGDAAPAANGATGGGGAGG